MTFNSITFFVFFLIVASLLLITNIDLKIKKEKIIKIRHFILLIASYVFYGWWSWKCALLMLGLTAIAYWTSLKSEKTHNKIVKTSKKRLKTKKLKKFANCVLFYY